MKTKEGMWLTVSGNPKDGWHQVTWEAGSAHIRLDADNLITDIWISKPTAEDLRRIPLSRLQSAVIMFGEGEPLGDRRYKLTRPKGRRLHPTFYNNVATAYRDAVKRGMHPRKTIAADTGAADATVAAWIMKARKLGLLPATQPGRMFARAITDRGLSGGDN